MSESIPEFFDEQKERVDRALDRILPEEGRNRLAEAMRYSVLGGGKRIRGILVLESARLKDPHQRREISETLSAVVELIHAYTLVHDDLPSMDDDDFRRGQPSCHQKFDEATAILCGNALLSLSYRTLHKLKCSQSELRGILGIMGDITGYEGVLEGQVRDLSLEGAQPTDQTVIDVYRKKTGYLIGFALELGGFAAGLESVERRTLRKAGRKLGIAFQIRDDLLELEENSERIGKDTESDKRKGKSTLVQQIGKEPARLRAEQFLEEGRNLLHELDLDTNRLLEFSDFLIERSY